MGYIVIFKRLAGIPNVAPLVPPMVQRSVFVIVFKIEHLLKVYILPTNTA